jgi:PKD repeat protein
MTRSQARRRTGLVSMLAGSVLLSVALVSSLVAGAGPLFGISFSSSQPAHAAEAPLGKNIVVNGGFEEPEVKDEDGWELFDSIPGWDLVFGPGIEVQRGADGSPYEGLQHVELDSHPDSSGIRQLLSTVPGTVYQLEFAFSARPETAAEDNVLGVFWDGDQVAHLGPRENNSNDTEWTLHTFTVVATASETPLEFHDLGISNSKGTYVDAVSVRAMTCVSNESGDWHSKSVWSCNEVPGPGNDAIIKQAHELRLERGAVVKTLITEKGSELNLNDNDLTIYGDMKHAGFIMDGKLVLDWSLTEPTERGDFEDYVKTLEGQLDSVGDDAQLSNVDLQTELQKQQQTLQMLSNISKMLHDTALSIIRKVGAVEVGTVASTGDIAAQLTMPSALVFTIVTEPNAIIEIGTLEIDSGTTLVLGENTHLTIQSQLTNHGSIFLPETSTLSLGDGATLSGSGDISGPGVFDDNSPPTVSEITAPLDPVPVDSEITVQARFSDPGMRDSYRGVWDWGDGTQCDTDAPAANCAIQIGSESGMVTGQHTYPQAGVYRVTLTVSDDDGSDAATFEYVVVYDPNGGFVTGAGWIDSPAGAYTADPSLTGRAHFALVSKYQKGATIPTGKTEFQFKAGDFHFRSTSYEWLVVSGPKGQLKGTGTINDQGNYGFLLTAHDGQVKGGRGVDKFRIKIWDWATDTVVYDNQLGTDDTANASQAIGGGSIVIHAK